MFKSVLTHCGRDNWRWRMDQNCGTRFRAVSLLHNVGCSNADGEMKIETNSCGVLGCPNCRGRVSSNKGKIVASRIGQAMLVPKRPSDRVLKFLTLTLRSGLSSGELLDQTTIRANAFKIRKYFKKWWTKHFRHNKSAGASVKIEFGKLGHVHLHALLTGIPYISNKKKDDDSQWLTDSWREVTNGEGYKCYIEDVKLWTDNYNKYARKNKVKKLKTWKDSVTELCKYVAKPGHDGLARILNPLISCSLWNFNRWALYGTHRGLKIQPDACYDFCPCCDSNLWHKGPWQLSPEAAFDLCWEHTLVDTLKAPRPPNREDLEKRDRYFSLLAGKLKRSNKVAFEKRLMDIRNGIFRDSYA